MLRLTLRGLLAHKLRFVMTTFAVVLGVGFVVGSFVVTDSVRRSVDTLFNEVLGGVDVTVRAESELGAMASRGNVSADLLTSVQAVDGVDVASATIGGYAQLLDEQGEPLTTTGAPFLGVGWGDDRFYGATLDEGRKPVGLGEVAVDRGTSQDYDLEVGDQTHVLLADGTQPAVEIVGVFSFGEANNLLGARVTAFDQAVAPQVFGMVGEVTSIDVIAAGGVSPTVLAERIQEVLPAGVEAVTTDQVVTETTDAFEGFVDLFQNILLAFAAVALFVSAFYINNTFSITVGQRTRELSLLRSLGASRRQIMVSVTGEALIVGILASLVGAAFGLLIAVVLQAVLAAGGLDLPASGLVLAARTWIVAGIVGVGVTLVAATSPARRAAAVPPMVGMREGFVPSSGSIRRRITVGAVLAVAGLLLVTVGARIVDGGLAIALVLGGGAMAAFIGIAQLSPVVAVPLLGALGRPFARILRPTARLAQANAVRSPERTAKTASALMIGLALVTTVFIVGASMKESFARAIDGAVRADFILSTSGQTGFSPALTDAIAELPEVEDVTGVRFDQMVVGGSERQVVALDADAAPVVISLDLQEGALRHLGPGAILLHQDPARDLGLGVGDHLTVEMAVGGPQDLEVVGIYADATFAGNYVIDMSTFEAGYPTHELDAFAFVKSAGRLTEAEVRAAIESTMPAYPQVTLEDRAEFQASQQAQMDGLLVAVNGLLGLALFIALLGIANTLALSVIERTRELGLLRAVGMQRRQVRRMVLAESLLVAILGATIGVAVGLVFGVAATSVLPASVVTTMVIPARDLLSVVVAAAICGVLAGVLPARRAARLQVLQAIASE